MKRKDETRNLRRRKKKIAKRNLFERHRKVQFYTQKNRYLEWSEGKGDHGKECTSTEGKTEQL